MPLPVIAVLILIGIIYLVRKKYASAVICHCSALIFLLLISLPTLPNYLLRKLETQYPQFDLAQKVDYIVVLGCRHTNDAQLPITSQVAPCTLVRANEAIRIFQQNPDAWIVTSGNVGVEPFSNAYVTKRLITELGIPSHKVVAVEKSKDTQEEARNLSPIVKGHKFALVTSASHMARAMTLFEQQELKPLPAPTGHLVRHSSAPPQGFLYPSSVNITKFERWWYEWLGRTWIDITD